MRHDVLALAHQAGRAILETYHRGPAEVTVKADDSPLTKADLASHDLLVAGLRRLTPDIPILSEEEASIPRARRLAWHHHWLVDPLDGTKEFIARNGEFTVNVALIEDGLPVLGVVHAPVLGTSYVGDGERAWRQPAPDAELEPIRATGTGAERLRVVTSRSHVTPQLADYLATLPPHDTVAMGSSLKLCLIAEGSADLYPRLGPTMEWDIAAGDAVLRAAGGTVVALPDEVPLRYNKPSLVNPAFLARSG